VASLRTQFTVGLFVIIGFGVAIVAVLWLGLAENMKFGTVYVAYFDESVSGLAKDSDVKYLGVSVGKVEDINISPASDLVEVIFRIKENVKFKQQIYARLEMAGITGMKFIELSKQMPDKDYPLPKLNFKPKHLVVPTILSSSQILMTAVDRILMKLDQLDIGGIGEQTQTTLVAIESLVNNLQPAAHNLSDASSATTQTMDEFQFTLRSLRQNMGSINRRSEIFEKEVAVTLQNVNELLNELRNQPSNLIFSRSVPQRDQQVVP